MRKISFNEKAQADTDAAIDWYIGESAYTAAEDFTNEIEQALELLKQFPEIGETDARDVRSLPLHSFPYSIIYRLHGDTLRVIAIAHHSRRPAYWSERK